MKKGLSVNLTPAIAMLKNFNRNSRTCVIVEPLWGISFNLFIPYASLYMLALGITESQIGLVSAAGLTFQMVFALFGGWLTDRYGRRLTTLIFDITAWTIPTLIWSVAWNIWFFLAAAVLNATVRIVQNSWNCLMIEDARPDERVHIFSWIEMANILAGFFAPLAGWFISRYTLVPAVRGLYFLAFVMMTAMILLRNRYTTETRVGLMKIEESRRHTFAQSFREYPAALAHLVSNPLTFTAFLLVLLNTIHVQLKNIYLGIILNRGIGIPQASIALFPAVTSVIVMFIYLFIMPLIGNRDPKKPLFWGFATLAVSYLVLLFSPGGSFLFVMVSTVIGAVGIALVTPFVNSNLANHVEDNHRAKTMSLIYAVIYGGTAPFSWIAGAISAVNPRLPAAFFAAVSLAGIAALLLLMRLEPAHEKPAARQLREKGQG